jgi:Zn-dependent protease
MRFALARLAASTIQIPRIGDLLIVLHPSFAVAVLVVTAPFWVSLTLAGPALALAAFAVIVLSIATHEFAHVTVARLFGVSLARIDLHALGSTTQLASTPERLSRHLAIAFAGPVSNLALALISCLLLAPLLEPHMVKSGCETIEDGYEALSFPAQAAAFAMFANLALAIVNLVPVRPLDGGWITYRDLRQRWGRRRADLVAGAHAVVLGASSLLLLLALLIVVVQV